jgi:predicted tellurium resistance membrane protein TerC
MDLAFSIDNIFACVAFTNKFWLICVGVFVGILAMRFVATTFVKLLEKYPSMEKNTYIVIAILGAKLIIGGVCDYVPGNFISPILNSHLLDVIFSLGILAFFFTPILFQKKHAGAR